MGIQDDVEYRQHSFVPPHDSISMGVVAHDAPDHVLVVASLELQPDCNGFLANTSNNLAGTSERNGTYETT